MDNVIIDVVIGLLLVYLVLALMVTKLQETIFGQWLTARQRTLHDMLDEALGRDEGLKARLLANPAIAGLYQGEKAARGLRDKGPSAIPSELFARALLVEVYDDGAHHHPSQQFASPRLFMLHMAPLQNPAPIWGTLRTLAPGNEARWADFEAAIAKWFDHIGERADGWFRRKALRRSFWVAFAVALVFNADSFQLAERFAGDPELRRSFVVLAQRTVAEFGSGATAGAPPATTVPAVPLAPALRADQALERASAQLVELYFRNAKLASFDPNRQALKPQRGESLVEACARARSGLVADRTEPLSNPKTWMQLLPPLRNAIKQLRLPERFEPGAEARDGERHTPGRDDRLRQAYECLGKLVGWIDLALGAAPEDATLASGLRAAAARLNEAGDALQEMIEDQGSGLLVRQLFLQDPEAFNECAQLPGMSRARLRACVASASTGRLSLPLGWTGRNIRQALCHAVEVRGGSPASDCPLGQSQVFGGHAGLGLKPLALQGPGLIEYLFLAIGILVTAVFVSLGAPFWFDLLGRVVKLRASGARSVAETAPAAAPQSLTPAATEAALAAAGSQGPEPFSDARNDFERLLTAGDKIELQHRLGVTPSGTLDAGTRAALVLRARELGIELARTDELSLQAFLRIVEKRPAALEDVGAPPPGAPATAAIMPGQIGARVAALAPRLAAGLGFAADRARAPDEQRALAMLYLFKQARQQQPALSPAKLPLNLKARAGLLNRLEDWDAEAVAPLAQLALPAADAAPGLLFAREPAPWLDWALGEIGQTQAGSDTRAASNPRVLAYLEAAGMTGEFGDNTDWCGAFVSWVIAQHQGERPAQPLPEKPAAQALRAASWLQWGQPRVGPPEPGDVLVLFRDAARTQHHVALVLQTQGDWCYGVGGNQDEPGCVCIGGWHRDAIAAARRPF